MDYAYLAGLIDGEGWIGLTNRGSDRPPRVEVSIGMTDEALIQRLHTEFGGMYRRNHRKEPNYRDMHHVTWAGGEARGFLRSVRPFLVMDRRRALADMVLDHEWKTFRGVNNDEGARRVYRKSLARLKAAMQERNKQRNPSIPSEVLVPKSFPYLAGIIDGEGHVSRHGRLDVQSTDPELMGYLLKFGGRASKCVGIRPDTHRQMFRWWTTDREGQQIMHEALPFIGLARKRAQAEAALSLEVPDWLAPLLPATSSEVVAATGIKHPKVCTILRALGDAGLLVKDGVRPTRRAGRDPVVWARAGH